jgi:hypothetical protein
MRDACSLDPVPLTIDVDGFIDSMHLAHRPEYAERCRRIARQGLAVARPKALYGQAYVDSVGEDTVVVDGTTLTSRVLAVNLRDVHRVFPFVATCGAELESWAAGFTDMLERFWADAIMESAVIAAATAVEKAIGSRHLDGPTGVMDPGSLEDWPLAQQRELFAIMGDVKGAAGVELTESCLMVPIKSVSGLRFPSEARYENCQLCPRDPCRGRRAAHDADLYARRYAGSGKE